VDRREQWQLDGSAPELYQRYLVPGVTAHWAIDLVTRIQLRPGERVLDVACGTGVVARAAAEQVGANGHVAAIDLNPGMLAVARDLAPPTGVSIEWREASASELPFNDGDFDAVLCQLGLQFFPDASVALRQMHRALVAGGRLGLSVYSSIERSPAALALADSLDRHLDSDASRPKRSEHSLAETTTLRRLVGDAGFREIRITTVAKTLRFPSATDWVRIQLSASPLASALNGLTEARAKQVVDAVSADVGAALAPYTDERGLSFPQEAHVLLATA